MRLRTWAFCLTEANQNLLRNPVLAIASITTTAVSLLVLGVFLLLSANVNQITNTIENQVAVRAFFSQSTTSAQEAAALAAVRGSPKVRSAKIVTRAQALSQLKHEFGDQGSVLNSLGSANPLEDSLSVTARTPSDVASVAKQLSRVTGVVRVSYQSQVVSRLFSLIDGIRAVGLGLGILLLLGALLVINNAIRLGIIARRREIAIMRLVGATESLVHWPFILEGLILGLIGSVVAAGASWWGYAALYSSASRSLPFVPLVTPIPFARDIALLLVILGVLLGTVGFRLSVRRLARV
ncbi:MAG: permease-like cell division protein FtsX [Thermaerobacter sp.]|nr:permease-like cell division protein FtsX [Thermaerobacter sp.]